MIARTNIRQFVADWMHQREIKLEDLIASTGLCRPVVEAIFHQRYTPSPEQRGIVSDVLGVDRDQIVWGHRASVDQYIHAPI